VNIALVNELAMLTDRMGIDIWEVLDAASTKPYGFMRYKPGVGYIRESPALKILTLLSALGADLRYHDPHVPTLPDYDLSSIPLDDALHDADLALIVTAHPSVDHDTVLKRARLIVDLCGITRGTRVENVVRL
jgi:UDP-N-acetyl-D-glucosamine dehydrogenase